MLRSPAGSTGPSIEDFLDRSVDLLETLELQDTALTPPIIEELVQDGKVQQGPIKLAIGDETRCLSPATAGGQAESDPVSQLVFRDFDRHLKGAKPTAITSNIVLEAGDSFYSDYIAVWGDRETTFFILARRRSGSQDVLDVIAYVLWPRHNLLYLDEPGRSQYNTMYLYVPSVPAQHVYVIFDETYPRAVLPARCTSTTSAHNDWRT